MNFPRATTDFFVQEYWDITLNAKLGKNRTLLGDKISLNPYFEPFETQNYIFLIIFGQNLANLRMAKNQNFNFNYTNRISTKKCKKTKYFH